MYKSMSAVLDIDTNKVDWKYKTSGHIIPINGAVGKKNIQGMTDVYFSDPHPIYPNRNYKRSVKQAFDANNNHFRHAMIW